MDTQGILHIFTFFLAWILLVQATQNNTDTMSLSIKRNDSTPNSLLITWQVPEGYETESFKVESQKKGSDSVIIEPTVNDGAVKEYRIKDLMTESKYEVCMNMKVVPVNASSGLEETEIHDCAILKTPPAIRADSLIVLFCVLGYVLLMVLLGYLCWRRAIKQLEPEEEEEEQEPIEEKIENGERRPFLLNSPPPANERPRSRIEDEDIPFITPTWDQIAKERGVKA